MKLDSYQTCYCGCGAECWRLDEEDDQPCYGMVNPNIGGFTEDGYEYYVFECTGHYGTIENEPYKSVEDLPNINS